MMAGKLTEAQLENIRWGVANDYPLPDRDSFYAEAKASVEKLLGHIDALEAEIPGRIVDAIASTVEGHAMCEKLVVQQAKRMKELENMLRQADLYLTRAGFDETLENGVIWRIRAVLSL